MAFYAAQVTTANNGVVYNLGTLVAAVDAAIPASVHQLTIQADPGNNLAKVTVGTANITDGAGYVLSAGNSTPAYQSNFNGIALGDFYLKSDTASSKLNVSLIVL